MGSCIVEIADGKLSATRPMSSGEAASVSAKAGARWPQIAVAASALLLAVSLPARASDVGSFFGSVVGGIISQSIQQPRPAYPPPTYYQPQYQQPQYQPDAAAAEARRQYLAHQAELKRQKLQQQKDDAARQQQAAAPATTTSGTLDVTMKRKDGNLWVPAQINKVVTIDFVIDSGASDITLPKDVYQTLIRSGTLTKADYIGTAQFGIADGSEVKGIKFKLASLQVGDQVLTDVVASVMPSDSATPLLGLSFLSRFQSWSVDNNSGTLRLVPLGGNQPAQLAAANPQQQPLTDLTTVPAPGTQTPAPAAQVPTPATQAPSPATQAPAPTIAQDPAPASAAAPATQTPVPAPAQVPAPAAALAPSPGMPGVMQTTTPALHVAASGIDTPRSGHVPTSALIVKDASTPDAAPAPAPAPTPAPATTVAAAQPPPAPTPAPKPETASAIPSFPANTSYADARSSLLALGYGPAPLPDAGKCDANTDSTCFPERLACTRTDSIHCDYFWRRGEQVIKVKTVAVPPTVAAIECQVNCK